MSPATGRNHTIHPWSIRVSVAQSSDSSSAAAENPAITPTPIPNSSQRRNHTSRFEPLYAPPASRTRRFRHARDMERM